LTNETKIVFAGMPSPAPHEEYFIVVSRFTLGFHFVTWERLLCSWINYYYLHGGAFNWLACSPACNSFISYRRGCYPAFYDERDCTQPADTHTTF